MQPIVMRVGKLGRHVREQDWLAVGIDLAVVAPALACNTFADVGATGNPSAIRSEEIKRALYDYHGYDETRRQWIQLFLAGEQYYFEIVAGVLDYDQERWVLGNRYDKPGVTRQSLQEFKLDPHGPGSPRTPALPTAGRGLPAVRARHAIGFRE